MSNKALSCIQGDVFESQDAKDLFERLLAAGDLDLPAGDNVVSE